MPQSSILFLGLTILVPSVMAASITSSFTDVPGDAWYASLVEEAKEAGIVSGYKNSAGHATGEFKPSSPVSGGEALKLAVTAAGYDLEKYLPVDGEPPDHWLAPYYRVATTETFGIVERMRYWTDLDTPATRAQVARMVADAFRTVMSTGSTISFAVWDMKNPYTDVDNSYPDFYEPQNRIAEAAAILRLSGDGIIQGDTDRNGKPMGTFRPKDRINRAETVKIIMTARKRYGTVEPLGTEITEGRCGMPCTGAAPAQKFPIDSCYSLKDEASCRALKSEFFPFHCEWAPGGFRGGPCMAD